MHDCQSKAQTKFTWAVPADGSSDNAVDGRPPWQRFQKSTGSQVSKRETPHIWRNLGIWFQRILRCSQLNDDSNPYISSSYDAIAIVRFEICGDQLGLVEKDACFGWSCRKLFASRKQTAICGVTSTHFEKRRQANSIRKLLSAHPVQWKVNVGPSH